jgi:hypothetical protein
LNILIDRFSRTTREREREREEDGGREGVRKWMERNEGEVVRIERKEGEMQ